MFLSRCYTIEAYLNRSEVHMSRTQLWVNVYEVSQMFGGPEEGGWFFDVGIPAWSQQALCGCHELAEGHDDTCPIHHLIVEAQKFIQGLEEGWDTQFISRDADEPEHRGERVYGKQELRVEEATGHAYPDVWPHYE